MKGKITSLFFLLIAFSITAFAQKELKSTVYNYSMMVPDSMNETTEQGNDSERTFYDNISGMVLLITVREGIFDNPDRYMNCSKKDLERELKNFEGDPTLTIISCDKSKYYPNEAVVLQFETSILPKGYNRCVIYFIHHRNKEMQFSYMFDKADNVSSIAYIDKVMQTLKLP